jgi:hypothetical protein
MARFDFCGGSYTVQAITADCQKCLNLYPEINESGDGRSKMILLNTPGLFSLAQVGLTPTRGLYEFNGTLYSVSGASLYQVNLVSPGGWANNVFVPAQVTTTLLNPNLPMQNDGLRASMAANENQLLIASGGSVYLYYINTMNDSVTGLSVAAGTFVQVAATNFTLASGNAPVKQVVFCDSFFLAFIANSQAVQISNVLDGNNWIPGGTIVNGTYTGGVSSQIVVSVFPENIVGMIVDHREVWFAAPRKPWSIMRREARTSSMYSLGDSSNREDVLRLPPISSIIRFSGCTRANAGIAWLGG